ncbi:HAD family hydrolase [Candidatus Woesearchaeota archaeon]|mgnify:CR=1|jgi:putative hydrolase of the HAD superfamily|nr:HAD family hydrolase [Candidatus Woesearchaeota archaeon]MBT4336028.1 HAD family hydrolase [Candidatus Woesearchaeota archaeon]MBT4468993.1 HAD family hydrolase [Candidatus Woesearchaeota archaeon]MBT6744688.1 HAD family hydrolase [Candidatus Woesearchaeota archaeon]
MTKAILFDFWGTLVENGVWSPIKQVKNILEIKLPFPEYVVRMERAMMTSKFENLKQSFENICKEFQIEIKNHKIETLVGMWNKNWMLAQPYKEVKEILTELRKKYKVILVSNTDCFSIKQVMEKFQLEELFDKTYLSCEVGLIKTDKNFFKHVLSDLGLTVDDAVMVGDSIQSDIMAAKKIDMKSVLIDRRNSREYHPKIKSLHELDSVLDI